MPSFTTVPRRRRRSEDTEDRDESPSQLSDASSSKRPRLQSADDDEDEGNSQESDEYDTPEPATQTLARQPSVPDGLGPGGYKPGAIVRIKVTNFVTYTSAEFFPGPKLNMVIGPNGTGKSTLVCAICLGLGWGPQHLGRAKDLGEFVKHGCREATIEIELSGPPKIARNPVICRNIKREGNKSSFTVNGKTKSRTDVLKLAQSFAIQIDNLCQFLPQDRVAEFAALTPIELLNSTQRAAAGPEMTTWHDALKKLRAEQKRLEIDNRGDKDMLANLENRQEMQRPDVERMRQRTEIERKIEILESLRPVVEYKEAKIACDGLKNKKNELQQEYAQLKEDLEPAMRAVTAKQGYIEQLADVRSHRKGFVEEVSTKASDRGKKIEDLENSIKDLNGQIEAEKKSGQKHKSEATAAQQNINRLRRRQEEEHVEFDIDYYNEKLREKRQEKRELETKAREIQDRRKPLFTQANELQKKIEQAEQRLQNLDSQSGRQEAKLDAMSNETLTAYRWILRHQDKFEKEVFGPPIVTCSVTDPKYADAMESLLQKNDFTTFTTQTRNDFRTLQRALNGEMKLKDISIRTCSTPLDSLKAPLSDDQLHQLGFEGWAKDFLNGPDPVLAMLCSENRLHQTPISLNDISDDKFVQLENSSLSSWVAGKRTYQVTRRREYGPGATSTRVRGVRPAQKWTTQPVDGVVKRELRQNIDIWKGEQQEVKDMMQNEKATMAEVQAAHARLEQERTEIEEEKAAKQTAHTQYRAIPEKISQQETRLKNMQELFAKVRERVREIRTQQDEIAIQKAEATIDYADTVDELRQAYEELMKVEILHLEAASDLQTLRNRNHECAVLLEQKGEQVKQALADLKAANDRGRELLRAAKIATRAAENQADAQAMLHTLGDHDMNQLNADIDSEKARLELTQGGSSHMIKEFEERERQIEKLQSKLAEFQSKLSDLDEAISEVRGKWEPKLDALVQKISDAFADSFARIGCAGQVGLDKVEDEPGPNGEPGGSDFDQWSIQIHVKFREHENLSLLNSHRQSGGERAVSTIFYLMALQSLSASPFRVVDEINQGMDPRNERMVHGRLVDIACDLSSSATDENGQQVGGGGGGQYFLITPKLLNGLTYKPGMRVLCIYSGEHMPENYGKLDFGKAIRTMRAVTEKSNRSCGRHQSKGKGKARALESSNHVDVYA